MKELKSFLSLLLVFAMIATMCCTILASCGKDDTATPTEAPTNNVEKPTTDGGSPTEKPTNKPTDDPTEKPTEPDPIVPDDKVTYTIDVKTAGGMALKDIMIFVYDGESIVGYATSNAEGKASVRLAPKDTYVAKVDILPDGYTAEESYPLTAGNTTVTLTSSVIVDADAPGRYELGDIMTDFTVTTYDTKEKVSLAELLKEKEMVLINYWYYGCSYCLQEFPEMEEMYRLYKDKIEIVALSPQDTDADIEEFMSIYGGSFPEGGLTFPVASDTEGIVYKFNPQGAPTSIIVDRYGMISLIVTGAMNAYEMRAIFDNFTGDDYEQRIITDPSILTPAEKPDIEMPSSEEMANVATSGDISATFYPETETADAEYSWPFIIGNKAGLDCIKPSNSFKPASFATLYVKVEMKKGDALAFDYWSSCETYNDVLYVLVDGKIIFKISGDGEDWQKCYPYVALEDGEYELCLLYLKGDTVDIGDDAVYIRNIRITTIEEIDVETYIYRDAATNLNDLGSGYENYVEVFFNETDGYYHVNSVDGPILLANLRGYTQFSNTMSVWDMAYNGLIKVGNVDYVDEIERYANYASNGDIFGYCSVDQRLRELLEIVANVVGTEDEPNEWLQMCAYYDAYGTNGKQLKDPVKGLAPFSAYDVTLGQMHELTYNKVFIPRGYLNKFVPETSGVYRITSFSNEAGLTYSSTGDFSVIGWLFNEDLEIIKTYSHDEKLWSDYNNVSMIVYLEAGKTYYIDLVYFDLNATGSFTFDVQWIGETADIFTLASPGAFTYRQNEDGTVDTGETVAGGVDVILVDGYYHALNEDGTVGDILYADFNFYSNVFPDNTILDMIERGVFDFTMNPLERTIYETLNIIKASIRDENGWDDDHEVILDEEDYRDVFVGLWGEAKYAQRAEIVAKVNSGEYVGYESKTEIIKKYAEMLYTAEDGVAEELIGCTAVTEELAKILQTLMNIYLFEGVDHSWTKLCFYYKHYGPTVSVN